MRSFLVFFAVVAAASAVPYKFEHDIKINVYDVLKSLYAAAPLSTYLDHLTKNEEFKFDENHFHFYPEEEIKEALVVYKPKGEKYLHSYYFKVEDASKYEDKFYDAVRPIYEYLNSGEYYAFTPYAAKKVVPEYFSHPLKEVFYKYYENVDLKHEIPVVFLVPKSEVEKTALADLILIAEYEITKDGVHDVHEYFDNVGKSLKRREAYFTAPYSYYRTAYPYAYSPSYVRGYPYPYYYGYPDYLRTGHLHTLSEHITV